MNLRLITKVLAVLLFFFTAHLISSLVWPSLVDVTKAKGGLDLAGRILALIVFAVPVSAWFAYLGWQLFFRISSRTMRLCLITIFGIVYLYASGSVRMSNVPKTWLTVTLWPLLMALYYWACPRLNAALHLEDTRAMNERRKGWSNAVFFFALFVSVDTTRDFVLWAFGRWRWHSRFTSSACVFLTAGMDQLSQDS